MTLNTHRAGRAISIQASEGTGRRRAQALPRSAQTPRATSLARAAAAWGDEHPDAAHVLKLTALLTALVALRVAVPAGFFALLYLAACLTATCLMLNMLGSERGLLSVLWDNLTFIDVPQLDGPDSRPELPVGTYGLIAINALVFYCLQTKATAVFLHQNLVFLPGNPTWVNTPLSAIVHLFLHANSDHLWSNMLWLWALGTVVERRLGLGRFLAVYLMTGIAGALLSLAMVYAFTGKHSHGLGASGAISGIIGIYLIRCYFKPMALPVPVLGFLSLPIPLNFKIRVNALLVLGYDFALDVRGGLAQLAGTGDKVGYLCHVMGLLAGMLLAHMMKCGEQARQERHLDLAAQVWRGRGADWRRWEPGLGVAEAEQALAAVLAQDPGHTEALLALARFQARTGNQKESKALFNKALHLLAGADLRATAAVYREYWNTYAQAGDLAPVTQYRLAHLLYAEGDYALAATAMEAVALRSPANAILKEKALYHCIRMLHETGDVEAADRLAQRFRACFGDSPRVSSIEALLARAEAAYRSGRRGTGALATAGVPR